MKFSTHYRCACTGPDGKLLGQACPKLWRKDGKTWNHRHGSAGWAMRIPASSGVKLVKRFGYTSTAGPAPRPGTCASCWDWLGLTRLPGTGSAT